MRSKRLSKREAELHDPIVSETKFRQPLSPLCNRRHNNAPCTQPCCARLLSENKSAKKYRFSSPWNSHHRAFFNCTFLIQLAHASFRSVQQQQNHLIGVTLAAQCSREFLRAEKRCCDVYTTHRPPFTAVTVQQQEEQQQEEQQEQEEGEEAGTEEEQEQEQQMQMQMQHEQQEQEQQMRMQQQQQQHEQEEQEEQEGQQQQQQQQREQQMQQMQTQQMRQIQQQQAAAKLPACPGGVAAQYARGFEDAMRLLAQQAQAHAHAQQLSQTASQNQQAVTAWVNKVAAASAAAFNTPAPQAPSVSAALDAAMPAAMAAQRGASKLVSRSRAPRVNDKWQDWALVLGAKARNDLIRQYRLTKYEAKDLKNTSRRMKQNLAQQRYLRRQRTIEEIQGGAPRANGGVNPQHSPPPSEGVQPLELDADSSSFCGDPNGALANTDDQSNASSMTSSNADTGGCP